MFGACVTLGLGSASVSQAALPIPTAPLLDRCTASGALYSFEQSTGGPSSGYGSLILVFSLTGTGSCRSGPRDHRVTRTITLSGGGGADNWSPEATGGGLAGVSLSDMDLGVTVTFTDPNTGATTTEKEAWSLPDPTDPPDPVFLGNPVPGGQQPGLTILGPVTPLGVWTEQNPSTPRGAVVIDSLPDRPGTVPCSPSYGCENHFTWTETPEQSLPAVPAS
jgi:hypothetical protein